MDYAHRPYPNRLKAIRQGAGYTQRRAAALLGHNTGNLLSLWEGETAMPSGENLIRLCVIYNKTVRELYAEHYATIEQSLIDCSLQ